jgi:hypothetical protein
MPEKSSSVIHDFGESNSLFSKKSILFFVVTIIVGVVVGYFLSQNKGITSTSTSTSGVTANSLTKGTVIGSNDTSTFKDVAEGVVKLGGIQGEGQFHLVRPGGESQYVYMTSSSVDLSLFVDKKVKVNGQTQKAQYAGWLMDVGRVEVE